MNEAFAHYMAILTMWELIGSKERHSRRRNPNEIPDIPDKNMFFFKKLNFRARMNSIDGQGPLYSEGRAFAETIIYVYNWGVMFVRMLEGTVGTENFQQAIKNYLNKYKHGNADHEQLFAEFEFVNPFKANKTSISTIFNSWIKQKGVPLVKVSRCKETSSICRPSRNQLLLQQIVFPGQGQFFDEPTQSPSLAVWYIPIHYALIRYENGMYSGIENHWFFMKNTKQPVILSLPGIEENDFKSIAILNINYTGTYHVTYEENEWKNIGSVMMENPDILPLVGRYQLFWSLQTSVNRKEIKPYMMLCLGEYLKVYSFLCIFSNMLAYHLHHMIHVLI